MLVKLIGHNDAPVWVNHKKVAAVQPGLDLGTTAILIDGKPPLIVQGSLEQVAKRLKRPG